MHLKVFWIRITEQKSEIIFRSIAWLSTVVSQVSEKWLYSHEAARDAADKKSHSRHDEICIIIA